MFFDIQKAFDSVNHVILLDKFQLYGIRGLPLKLFRSYLTGRTKYVFTPSACSGRKDVVSGAPQGSIWGPILFLLFINDIVNVSKEANFVLYADDANVFFCAQIVVRFRNHCEWHGMCNINVWMRENKLRVNLTKTKYIVFKARNKQISFEPHIFMVGVVVERVPHTQFRGVHFEQHLG